VIQSIKFLCEDKNGITYQIRVRANVMKLKMIQNLTRRSSNFGLLFAIS